MRMRNSKTVMPEMRAFEAKIMTKSGKYPQASLEQERHSNSIATLFSSTTKDAVFTEVVSLKLIQFPATNAISHVHRYRDIGFINKSILPHCR